MLAAAGSGLRDLIIPEPLANAIGMWGGRDQRNAKAGLMLADEESGYAYLLANGNGKPGKSEKVREQLENLLAGSCPLCESVVSGLDKPFVFPGEEDDSWQL